MFTSSMYIYICLHTCMIHEQRCGILVHSQVSVQGEEPDADASIDLGSQTPSPTFPGEGDRKSGDRGDLTGKTAVR